MGKKQILTKLCLLIILSSCTSVSVYRNPSSFLWPKEREEIRNLKQRKIELSALSAHFQKKGNEIIVKKIENEQKKIDKKINKIESSYMQKRLALTGL